MARGDLVPVGQEYETPANRASGLHRDACQLNYQEDGSFKLQSIPANVILNA